MAQSRSKTQKLLMDVSVKRQRIKSLTSVPTLETHRVSRIEAQGPQGDMQEGQRLMIIKLARYNEIGGLLIETGATGS